MDIQPATEIASKLKEERRYLRYAISGSCTVDLGGRTCSGTPLNVSLGGVLFQADTNLQTGTHATILLEIFGFNEKIVAKMRVVRTVAGNTAAVFLEPPAELVRLIALLAA